MNATLALTAQPRAIVCPLCNKPACKCANERGPFKLRYNGYSSGEFTYVRLAVNCFRVLKQWGALL
jgi:hypothetical protein